MESTNNAVVEFIKLFQTKDTVKLFTEGLCYWFSVILSLRFLEGIICYDQIDGHFVTLIGDKYYDITGEVTPTDGTTPWINIEDELLKDRIYQQVILKI